MDAETQLALRKLAIIVLVLLLLAVATYVLPLLARYRPWVPQEGFPLVRLFQPGNREVLPGFAEAEAFLVSSGRDSEKLNQSLGSDIAQNLESKSQPSKKPVKETKRKEMSPTLRISPEELQGLVREIEDPHGRSLEPFYSALLRTAQRRKGAITRIAHYGDSAVASDNIAYTLRRKLQLRFGDSGHGFILMARGRMHYRHRDIMYRGSDNWEAYPMVHKSLGTNWYGYGGVQFRGSAGSRSYFSTVKDSDIGKRVSRFEIFYQRYKRGGKIKYTVDGKKRGKISTRSKQQEDAWEVIRVPDGHHSISIRASGYGKTRIYGVALERDTPGVVYDSLGMVAGQAQHFLHAEAMHMKNQIRHRNPDLIILGFGGNEAGNAWLNLERYEKDLTQVVKLVRENYRNYPCILMGPLDQGQRNKRGRVQTLEKLPLIVEAQRRVAKAQSCGFFDTYQAMGGEDSIWRWYKSRPRLATSDFRHATPTGYEVIGNMFYKALLKGFSDYLKRVKR